MRKYICLLIVILMCSCATSTENIQKASAHYKLGVSYLNEDSVQPAFIEFQKAYELNPEDKEVLYAIGMIYLLRFEDFQKAVEFFQKAIRVDTDFSEAHNSLGYTYYKAGRFSDAINSFKKALSNLMYRTPEYAYDNIGMLYYRTGRYDEAIDSYKEAIKRKTDFYRSYYGLALCYNAKARYGDAATAITMAIQLDPLYKGDKDKAMNDFKQRKLKAKGNEEKDIADYIEILRY